jgi:bacterioferritin-associated ferredoxin
MGDHDQDEQDEIICDCSGTTRAKVNQLIDQGIDNVDRISAITGACSGCGACDTLVEEMLNKTDVDCQESAD